jgi:hypothetical protein
LRLPDFLVGGAPRAGTSMMSALLDRHPSIYMAKPAKPEPKFFLVDALYEKGLEYYSRTWFNGVGAEVRAGEKSTDYLESATAAARIARDLPDVRLVFVLRDPVARAYSNYLWTKMNGLEREDFKTALLLEETRERELPERLRFARPYSYYSRGLYAEMLQPYFERFPREHMLVLRFEDIVDSPRVAAERLHRFVRVETRPADGEHLGVINASEKDGETLADDLRQWLSERYDEPNRRLGSLLGSEFRLWP